MHSFRFGVNTLPPDEGPSWSEFCRSTEAQGFDLLLCPDHLGAPAPFAALAAAAEVTERVRLGTYVLNNEFWNPALLAREVATLDRLSGGRFELGLGVGHKKAEFDDAGIPWRPHPDRVQNLTATLDQLDRRLADGGQQPQPVQRPRPPILIGGHGSATLTLAAQRADIIGFTGASQLRGRPLGTFRLADSAETSQRVELARSVAGERADDLELGVLIQWVEVTDNVERTAADLLERFGSETVPDSEPLWQNPYLLMGTPDEMAQTLIERRDRFGFTHIVTHGASRDGLARVIEAIRG